MPTWNFPRSPVGARLLVRAGAASGMSPQQCLDGTGLTERDLSELPEIEATQELRVGTNLVRALGDVPGLGARAGREYTLGTVGIWGFALLTSPTWGDAIEVGARYFQLTTAFLRPELCHGDDETVLVLHDEELPGDVRDLFAERDLAAVARLISLLVNELPEVRLETRFDTQRAATLSGLLPNGQFTPGRPQHVLALAKPLMDTPLPQADEQTWNSCKRDCEALLATRPAGMAARVRSELFGHPGRNVGMDEIATLLYVDVRTLRRRLAEEGTSFRALKAECHATLAIEMLSTVGLSVAQVAQRLGYSDPTSFSHAFVRWTGRRPNSYRTRPNRG